VVIDDVEETELAVQADQHQLAVFARHEIGQDQSRPNPTGVSGLTLVPIRCAPSSEGQASPGATVFISHRTDEWHLHKVFIELDVVSGDQLSGALAGT
jgi:hypothetical protein